MNTVLTLRPWSVRLVAGALLAGLLVAAALLARVLPRTASSAPDLSHAAVAPVSAGYAQYLNVKERQAEQRDSTALRTVALTAPGPRERYEAVKEQQAGRRDSSTAALVAATLSVARERYEAVKEQQADSR